MRILILNQYCTPEPNFKSVPFARELIRRGHEVCILTGFPNYPGGKLYPGYRQRWRQRETLDGVPILRIPYFISHDRSGLRRMVTYGSFALAATGPLLFGWKPDLIYVWHLVPTGLAAALAGSCRRVPFVIDIQDLWPDAVLHSGMGHPCMRRALHAACNLVYRCAARVVVLSPGFKQRLIERGVPPAKIDLIYNWCDEFNLLQTPQKPADDVRQVFSGHFNILFAGMMNHAQGLDAVFAAAASLSVNHPQIQFVFMGGGSEVERLRQKAGIVSPTNTRFLPRCSSSEAAGITSMADAMLVHLRKDPLFTITIPSKIGACLAMAKPILIGVQGDASDLVLRAGAGITCEPESPASIADAAVRMSELPTAARTEMGRSGAAFYRRELSLSTGVDRFESLFQRVLTEQKSS